MIEDTYGNSYTSGDDFTNVQDASTLKMELEEKYNNLIRTRVMQVLLPLYGEDNIHVSVNTVVDLDRTYTDSTDYSLEDWATGKDDGIIGKQIYDNSIVRDDGQTNAGGEVGTNTNSDLNTYVENQTQPTGDESAITSSGETDRLVDTTKEQVEHLAGYISDVMVSVTINSDAAEGTNTSDLYDHVGRAAGISQADQQSKISILVSPFYQEGGTAQPGQTLPAWALYAAIGGIVLFLLILLLVLLIHRHRVKKRRAAEAEQAQAVPVMQAQPVQPQPDIMEMQTERSMELRQDVRKFTEENPEIAAQMVKNWLRESETS